MSLRDTRPRIGRLSAQTPNWSREVTEKYSFQTRIETFRDGSEQRIAQRANPRIEVSFRSDDMELNARRVHSDAQSYTTEGPMVMGVPWRSVNLTDDLAGGETSITVDGDVPWWIVADGWLVIESTVAREAVQVASVAGSTVTLVEALTGAHGTGATASWGLMGLHTDKQVLKAVVATHLGGTTQFQAKPGLQGSAKPISLAPFHDDLPVLIQRPNWVKPVQIDMMDNRELVDFSYGRTDEYWVNKQITTISRWTYTDMTADKVDQLIAFFHQVRGRQKPFWGTTHLKDFNLTATSALGSNTLTVEGDYTTYVDDPVHNAVWVRYPDGCIQINTISGITESGSVSTITFDGTWGRDVTPDAKVSWAYLSRFASDSLEVNWITDEVANVSIATQAIRAASLEAAGAPSYVVPFRYGNGTARFWTSADGDEWGQIDMGSELTEADYAAGRGIVSARYTGWFNYSIGLTVANGRVDAYFFDSNGDEVPKEEPLNWVFEVDRVQPENGQIFDDEGNIIAPDTPFDYQTPSVIPPPGVRYIRFAGTTNQGSRDVVGTGFATVGRSAGVSSTTTGAGEGAIICP